MFKDFEREKQLKESEQFLDELQEELEEKQIYEKQSLQEMSRLSTKKTTSDETMTILEEQYTHLSNLYEERLRREISEVEFQKKLNEMATEWSFIKIKLTNEFGIRWEHLIKIYYYEDFPEYHSGWLTSIRKGLEHVSKIKGKNKYPSFDSLYKLLWEDEEDTLQDFHNNTVTDINKSYDKLPKITNSNFEGVKDFMQKFTEWSCHKISEKGSIDANETQQKIYELLGLN
ncbi:MAG: hypothetical protein ACI4LS_05970 [Treponema sp.]